MGKVAARSPRPFLGGVNSVEIAAQAHRNRSRVLAEAAEKLKAKERAKRARTTASARSVQAGGSVRLSPREVETVVLYVSGLSARSVAERLGVGHESVRTMLKRARAKYAALGHAVGTKLDLRQRLVEDGLIGSVITNQAQRLPSPGHEA